MLRIYFILLISFITFGSVFSQSDSDSLAVEENTKEKKSKVRRHPPGRAMLFSVVLPGAGQVYNKKYWKVPLVYASMGATIYFAGTNHGYFKDFHKAYIHKTDGKDSTIDFYPDYTEEQLYELENYHRKYRDLNIILTALFYTLNVVDAYVDGHLMNFDVSDDLTLHVLPSLNMSAINRKPRAGITLALTF